MCMRNFFMYLSIVCGTHSAGEDSLLVIRWMQQRDRGILRLASSCIVGSTGLKSELYVVYAPIFPRCPPFMLAICDVTSPCRADTNAQCVH